MRSQLTPHAIASDVRMRRTLHKGSFLLVEGPSDKSTFRNLTDPASCQIVITHGWENAQSVSAMLEQEGFPGVLTVLDADFRRLENWPPPQNILLTDFRDFECMMLASPALAKLLGEFTEVERLTQFERRTGRIILETLTQYAAYVGYLRWVSLRHKLDLRFEGLEFRHFVDKGTLQVDQQKLIDACRDHSQRHDIDSRWLSREIQTLLDPNRNPLEVCCGHDVLDLLSFALCGTLASHDAREVGHEILERGLRLAYESAYFKTSELAGAILHGKLPTLHTAFFPLVRRDRGEN